MYEKKTISCFKFDFYYMDKYEVINKRGKYALSIVLSRGQTDLNAFMHGQKN